jgi:hypothetical protein
MSRDSFYNGPQCLAISLTAKNLRPQRADLFAVFVLKRGDSNQRLPVPVTKTGLRSEAKALGVVVSP